jgi:hypothetical protein
MNKGKKWAQSLLPQDLVDQASADIEEIPFLPLITAPTLTASKSKRTISLVCSVVVSLQRPGQSEA